jgi:hypothetical protein
MLAFALVSVVIHFTTGWYAYVEDASSHNETARWGPYLVEWTRQTFENWQWEFVQLAVQMALLAGFFKAIGVTAYEEDNEHLKERVDRLSLDVAEIRGERS